MWPFKWNITVELPSFYDKDCKEMKALKKKARRVRELGIEAIKRFEPNDGMTFCNLAVNFICREAIGYEEFSGLLANQMIDKMMTDADFSPVEAEVAKRLSDMGHIVIAGVKREPHGHVAVVCPGKRLIYSGKWQKKVPSVINVGTRNAILGANYAFKDEPRFWVYLDSSFGGEYVGQTKD